MKAKKRAKKTTLSRKQRRTNGTGKKPTRLVSKPQNAEWMLRLYVAGQTPRSLAAFSNLKKLCDEHLGNRYAIEVVDLSDQPQLAHRDQIVALPTLVRKLPEPIKRVIGDLSNSERVMLAIDLEALPRP